jgi:hypothetical protein
MEKKIEKAIDTPRSLGGYLAGGGLISGLAALLGASCCVLPILLVQIGVSTALVAHLAIFAQAKPYLLALTAALILAGFVAAFLGRQTASPSGLAAAYLGRAVGRGGQCHAVL